MASGPTSARSAGRKSTGLGIAQVFLATSLSVNEKLPLFGQNMNSNGCEIGGRLVLVNKFESIGVPKFFAMIPFWIWPIFGLICLILSVPGFVAMQERKERAEALSGPPPELVDLEEFDPAIHASPSGEVNIFAQSSPDYRFLVDATGFLGGSGYAVPLFSAVAGPKEKSVRHVLFVRDLDAFEPWLKDNSIGTARMGNLYEINGEIAAGRGFTAAIRVTLRDAGLEQIDPVTIVRPFLNGREAGLATVNTKTYGNPFILAASGIWMIWFGFVVWSRAKAVKASVGRRMGEIGDRVSSDGEVNLSRLKRSPKELARAVASKKDDEVEAPSGPTVTPAE